tara:strand:+ start:1486 stop:1623 length:138 start_codon:yes stop_codon:yes gene_type:complete
MRCGACGCLVEGKAKMQTSRCPMGKWENGKKSNNPETKVHQNGKK